MRRGLAWFGAIILLLLSPGYVGRASAAGVPTLRVSSASAAPGEDVVALTIRLEDNPGIIGMTLSIDYDHSRLEFIAGSGTVSPDFGGTGLVSSNGSGLAWGNTADVVLDGAFATLQFKVLETAAAGFAAVTLSYEDYNIINGKNENVHFDLVDGGIQVTQPVTPPESTPMYRLYNPYTLEHLFTNGEWEKDNLPNAGWIYEGVAWSAPTTGSPIYRLYNPYSDGHFYTGSREEVDSLLPLGWMMDGVVSYSAPSTGTPIYRLFNPYEFKNYHHYTTSSEEIEMLVGFGWILEGIAWYAA